MPSSTDFETDERAVAPAGMPRGTRRTQLATGLGAATIAALALTACAGEDGEGELEAEPQVETELDLEVGEVELITPGTLTVCSDVPYPPFEYYDADGDVVGFDIDIAEGIADVLDVELDVVQTSFEGIQSGVALNAETCDLAISGMTITEDRAGNMLFSDPYLDDNLGLLAASDSGIESLEDIDDSITVGVQADTTGEDYADEHGYQIRSYPDSGLLIQGLESGQVEAAIGNISILGYQAGEDDASEFIEEIDTGEQLGIAAQLENQQLIDVVDEILAEMVSSGYMAEIEELWFGGGETPEEGDVEDDEEDDEEADAEDADADEGDD
ncbi:ABC transporter substrate-binding protein [Nesterenkonia suensis]